MSYFQIAAPADGAAYADLEACLREIESAGVTVARKERFPEEYALIGFNVFVADVPAATEAKWQRAISRIIRRSPGELDYRFRFKTTRTDKHALMRHLLLRCKTAMAAGAWRKRRQSGGDKR